MKKAPVSIQTVLKTSTVKTLILKMALQNVEHNPPNHLTNRARVFFSRNTKHNLFMKTKFSNCSLFFHIIMFVKFVLGEKRCSFSIINVIVYMEIKFMNEWTNEQNVPNQLTTISYSFPSFQDSPAWTRILGTRICALMFVYLLQSPRLLSMLQSGCSQPCKVTSLFAARSDRLAELPAVFISGDEIVWQLITNNRCLLSKHSKIVVSGSFAVALWEQSR